MKNLHKRNLIECVRAAGPAAGWEVVETDRFCAVKSPVREAFANFVWADAEPEAIARARAVFGSQPFTWVLDADQDSAPLRAAGLPFPEPVPELMLDLDRYSSPGHGRRIRIRQAESMLDFPFWAATASEALGLGGEAVRDFFLPLVRAGGAVPLLAWHDGLPAATALAFCGEESLGVYAVGTRPAYRRMGLGRAVTQACLTLGQDLGQHVAVLSSSAMGLPMYLRIGFRRERTAMEWVFLPGLL